LTQPTPSAPRRNETPAGDWVAAGEHLGRAYLRYSFTKGTEHEVAFMVEHLGLRAGMRVLDVGCGPGRHSHALARQNIEVVGVDISPRFIDVAREAAPAGATFEVADARRLNFDAEFDAVISLCQGGFGLVRDDDPSVLDGIVRALRPGGRAAISAFSAYFQVRYLEEGDTFDAATGTNIEHTTVRNESGEPAPFVLETTCFTPRELRLLAAGAGLDVEHLWSVTPGKYEAAAPSLDTPEFLLVARKPR